jgi:hypothetical protein
LNISLHFITYFFNTEMENTERRIKTTAIKDYNT